MTWLLQALCDAAWSHSLLKSNSRANDSPQIIKCLCEYIHVGLKYLHEAACPRRVLQDALQMKPKTSYFGRFA